MGKLEKKKKRLEEKIAFLEEQLQTSLTQKSSMIKEIDVAGHTRKIAELRKELLELK
jgi:hypothetical protein